MEISKHIFLQVDTNSIIALGTSTPSCNQVRAYTYIYDKGSMVMGNAIDSFVIEVEANMSIYFSILPLQLYSYHEIYFTEFVLSKTARGIAVPGIVYADGQNTSLTVPVKTVDEGGEAAFTLNAIIQTAAGTQPIVICIDPVLRVKQG